MKRAISSQTKATKQSAEPRGVTLLIARSAFVLAAVVLTANLLQAADTKASYPSMAPVEQYLSADRNTEIALARSAAPDSISKDAEILVLTPQRYETAVKGTNGFVCLVQRAWVMNIDNPEFWNPHLRAPICLNAEAARSIVPLVLKKTELVLSGQPKEHMAEVINATLDKKEVPAPGQGAMSYMMSKQGYLNDEARNWHPHVMFFTPTTAANSWGANLAASPMLADNSTIDRMTIFMITVSNWSDGSPDTEAGHKD